MNQIGELVKRIREQAGKSQKEFAEQLGIGQSQLSLIESGQRKPGRQVIKKLAEISGLDAVNFID